MTQEEKAKKWDELTNMVNGYFDDDDCDEDYDGCGDDYELTDDDILAIGEYVLMKFDLI